MLYFERSMQPPDPLQPLAPLDPQLPSSTPQQQPDPRPSAPGAHARDLFWVFAGDHGLRSGWAVLLFVGIFYAITFVLDTVAVTAYPALADNAITPINLLIGELLPVLAIVGAGLFVARVQQRHILVYNLRDAMLLPRFVAGSAAGFVALSFLVGVEVLGGWLRFGPQALHGVAMARYAAIWAVDFLLVGLFEEGSFRCFLLATIERGINFRWALTTVAVTCAVVGLRIHAQGAGGVYLAAALGIAPCWLLERARARSAGFWQAAWTTSTAFGAYHTANHGETALGIFTAAAIGFVFCASVRLTGSAWWAIGCHAAWDWAETYFYGTANSGFSAPGHLLTTRAQGNPLLSGGVAGPEGSLLAVPVTALLLVLVALVYRGPRVNAQPHAAAERLAG